MSKPSDNQVGGSHYKSFAIDPLTYIEANGLGFCEGNIIKYASRWKFKNGTEDLKKVIHYAQTLIEFEEKKIESSRNQAQSDAARQGDIYPRTRISEIHPRRVDDPSYFKQERAILQSGSGIQITYPATCVSEDIRKELSRHVQSGTPQSTQGIPIKSAMGNAVLFGSSISFPTSQDWSTQAMG